MNCSSASPFRPATIRYVPQPLTTSLMGQTLARLKLDQGKMGSGRHCMDADLPFFNTLLRMPRVWFMCCRSVRLGGDSKLCGCSSCSYALRGRSTMPISFPLLGSYACWFMEPWDCAWGDPWDLGTCDKPGAASVYRNHQFGNSPAPSSSALSGCVGWRLLPLHLFGQWLKVKKELRLDKNTPFA